MNIKTVPSKLYFCHSQKTTLNKVSQYVPNEVEKLYHTANNLGLDTTPPLEFIYYGATADRDHEFILNIGLPVKTSHALPADSPYKFKNAQEFKSYSYLYEGNMEGLVKEYDLIFQKLFSDGLQPTQEIREVYQKFTTSEAKDNLTEVQIGIL